MDALTVAVPGMTCRHCVRAVTAALRDVPGVEAVRADAATASVVLLGTSRPAEVLAALEAIGFPGAVTPTLQARVGPLAD